MLKAMGVFCIPIKNLRAPRDNPRRPRIRFRYEAAIGVIDPLITVSNACRASDR